jgi:hypothetical protein
MCTRIAVSFECQFCSPFVSTIFPPDPNHGPRRRAVGRWGGGASALSRGRRHTVLPSHRRADTLDRLRY